MNSHLFPVSACVNFAYEPDVYGISFVVTLDDKALINETISGLYLCLALNKKNPSS